MTATFIRLKLALYSLQGAANMASSIKFRESMVGLGGPNADQPDAHVMEITMAMNDMDDGTCNIGSQFMARAALLSPSSGPSGGSGDYQDCNASPLFRGALSSGEPSIGSRSPDSVSIAQARDSAMLRYKEKRKNRRFIPTLYLFFLSLDRILLNFLDHFVEFKMTSLIPYV